MIRWSVSGIPFSVVVAVCLGLSMFGAFGGMCYYVFFVSLSKSYYSGRRRKERRRSVDVWARFEFDWIDRNLCLSMKCRCV